MRLMSVLSQQYCSPAQSPAASLLHHTCDEVHMGCRTLCPVWTTGLLTGINVDGVFILLALLQRLRENISAPAQSLHRGLFLMLPRQRGPHTCSSSIFYHSVYIKSQQHNLHYRQSYSSFLIRVQHIFSVCLFKVVPGFRVAANSHILRSLTFAFLFIYTLFFQRLQAKNI